MEIHINLDSKEISGELDRLKDSATELLETVKEKLPFEANQLRNIIERFIAIKR